MRVLVVAAGTMAQAGMASLVDSVAGLEVAAAVAPAEAIRLARELSPEACLVDAEGLEPEMLREIVARAGCPVIAVGEAPGFRTLLDTGAAGVLTPGIHGEALQAALEAAARGVGVVFPVTALRGRASVEAEDRGSQPVEALTRRELEVLSLMAAGLTNQALALRLGISEHTAKFHVGSVLGKLGAQSRAEAVTIGYRRGLIAV